MPNAKPNPTPSIKLQITVEFHWKKNKQDEYHYSLLNGIEKKIEENKESNNDISDSSGKGSEKIPGQKLY